MSDSSTNPRKDGWLSLILALGAVVIALASALPYAGSWNDGSRLATVESLVDHRTWAIDDSIFVKVPASPSVAAPYASDAPALLARGTQDKMWIAGHFYSDKSPVPALLMAAAYQLVQWTTGLVARERPDWFCYVMTFLFSGMPYAISVWCIDRLAVAKGLPRRSRTLLTASFALATIALPYARQVNNHILLLAVCSALMLVFARSEKYTTRRLLAIGTLIGAGYTIDLGIGPVLVICAVALVAWKSRSLRAPFIVLAMAFPWFALHHALNYRIGGGFFPANSNPAWFLWPGSPFSAEDLTGGWHHASAEKFVGYALDLLFGGRGFFTHNLPLFLVFPGVVLLLRSKVPETPEILFALSFGAGSWLLYSVTSSNHAGLCCSVRWLVPLVATGFYILVVLLREIPRCETDLAILSTGGVILGALMWWKGPWMARMVPGLWFIVGATLLAWLAFHRSRVLAESRKS